MSDDTISNRPSVQKNTFVGNVRVFQRPRYMHNMPSSSTPISGKINTCEEECDLKNSDAETKELQQLITAKSDIKIPHILLAGRYPQLHKVLPQSDLDYPCWHDPSYFYHYKRTASSLPHVLSKYANTYELEKFKGNRMIIFNHYEFSDTSRRPGTHQDEVALRETFLKFNFEVQSHLDLTKKKLMDTVRKFAQADFSECGCVCVAILTHGHDKPGYLAAYDQRYSEHEILIPFDSLKNPTLAGTPIIFIIQACRGVKPSMKVCLDKRITSGYQLDLADDDEDTEAYHLPTEADRIIFHSSAVGRASIRNPHRGSWFIQSLCHKIQEHAHKDDLETIFRLVKREVALNFLNNKDWKQMPVVTSTLLRELYLVPGGQSTPYKDQMDYLCREVQKPWPETPNDSPDSSLTPVQPIHMPCSCFLEYFHYLKKCLMGFLHHNPDDTVAENLLKMIQRVGDGAEYNVQRFTFIEVMLEHFKDNMDKFPPDSAKFLFLKFT